MLTKDQKKGFEQLKDYFKIHNTVVLRGSAGTGKTFLMKYIVEYYVKKRWNIICTAPTNKALSVLKGKVDIDSYRLEFSTIHSALTIKKQIDKEGNIFFGVTSYSKMEKNLKNIDLIIIDEASMVSSEIIDILLDNYKGKLLFVGDNKQLNPVNEDDSPVFIKDFPTVSLTNIVRQSEGNPIINLSMNLPKIFLKVSERNDSGGFIYTYDIEKIITTLAISKDPDNLKYIAYTNREVDRMNMLVRKKIYGDNPNKLELGEQIIVDESYLDIYYTNEIVKIDKLETITVPITKFISVNDPDLQKIFLKIYKINGSALVIHEHSESIFKMVCAKLVNIIKKGDSKLTWVNYYSFTECFMKFKYSYAITCHKSQGSTYKQVILNIKDMMLDKNEKERERLLYTAITRASELVILYNV